MGGLHRKRKRETSTDDYAAMLTRMLAGYGNRIAADPGAALPHWHELEAALDAAVNSGVYRANKVTGTATINQMAAVLRCSKQAVHKRVQAGERVTRALTRPRRAREVLPRAVPRPLPPGRSDAA